MLKFKFGVSLGQIGCGRWGSFFMTDNDIVAFRNMSKTLQCDVIRQMFSWMMSLWNRFSRLLIEPMWIAEPITQMVCFQNVTL